MKYKGFTGTVEWSETDGVFFGQVLNIAPNLVSYEGDSEETLEIRFQEAIDDYLEYLEYEKY